jgi:hypothetical protein
LQGGKMTKEKIETALKDGADNYYLSVMNDLSAGKKFRWNWGAFVGGPLWLAYRKMYLYSFVCLMLIVLFVIGIIPFDQEVRFDAASDAPKRLLLLSQLFLSIFFGFWGNNLYYRSIRKKIKEGYHVCKEYKSTNILIVYCFVLFFILMPIGYLRDKARVKKSLGEAGNFNADFSDKNVESVTSASSHYMKKFSKIEQGRIFSINWEIFALSHFGSFWFFYKKIYKYGFIVLTAEIIH